MKNADKTYKMNCGYKRGVAVGILLQILVVSLLVIGCGESEKAQSKQADTTKEKQTNANTPQIGSASAVAVPAKNNTITASHANAASPESAAIAAPANQGKVISQQQASAYSYLEVRLANGKNIWIASNRVNVNNGDDIQWGRYAVMRNFASKKLGRTFAEILFVNSVESLSKQVPNTQAVNKLSGKVTNVYNGGGYSFVEVATESAQKWLAAPQREVQIGDEISWSAGTTMTNFFSKSLDRTFAAIDFVAGISVSNVR